MVMAVLRLFIVLLAALASEARAEVLRVAPPANGERIFVLAVGSGTFDDDFWPALKWTEADAGAVARTIGAGTGREVLVTRLIGPRATLAEVRIALDRIARDAMPRDTVAVYFSTHGTLMPAPGNELLPVLVLRDTRVKDLAQTALSHAELRRKVDAIRAARKVLVIASCHSGLGKSRLSPRVQELLAGAKGSRSATPLADVSEGTLVLAAAASAETAREDDALKGDVYTHYFLEGLGVYDRNHDGMVTALEAHDYAKERTFERTGGRQRPTVEALFVGDADVPLRGRRTDVGLPVLESYGDELTGLEVRVKGGGKGQLPTAVPLAAGVNTIEFARPGEKRALAAYRVRAVAGERIEAADLLAGPRFSLKVAFGLVHFADARAARFAGSGAWKAGLGVTARVGDDWLLGVEADTLAPANRGLRRNLNAALTDGGTAALAGWRFKWAPAWGLRLTGLAGSRSGRLTLSDGASSLRKSANASIYGFGSAVVHERGFGFGFEAEVRYLSSHFAFGDYGTIDRSRAELLLAVSWGFGGAGMRVSP